ncbi:MAG TPA: extracellular solute-binding protein, partial [Ktedonobacteraceae bacterium]|nr:extracellular solute-binding protein [Ktedonobacteraceae bacterium]
MQLNHRHRSLGAYSAGGNPGIAQRMRPDKKLSLGLVFTLLMLLLAACGSSGAATQQGGTVHLTYALWDANQQTTYQKSIDEFEKLHPNIKVTIEQNPWTAYWQKLDTQIAGNSAPDVFADHVAYFPQLVQEGALMNLTPLMQQDKLDQSVYYPQLLKPYQYQGNTYGLPKDWDTITLYYNKALIQKAGIDINNLSWNPTNAGQVSYRFPLRTTRDQLAIVLPLSSLHVAFGIAIEYCPLNAEHRLQQQLGLQAGALMACLFQNRDTMRQKVANSSHFPLSNPVADDQQNRCEDNA